MNKEEGFVYAYEQMTNKLIKINADSIKNVEPIPKGSCITYELNGERKKLHAYDAVWRIKKQIISNGSK